MKQVKIIVVSSHYPSWAVQAEGFYKKQIRGFRIEVEQIRPVGNVEKESISVLAKLPKNHGIILLDVLGDVLTSENFANQISLWLTSDKAPVFVIGGPNGVGERLKNVAMSKISLSAMTLPHAIARLMLVEQLFRFDCIARNHPYPR